MNSQLTSHPPYIHHLSTHTHYQEFKFIIANTVHSEQISLQDLGVTTINPTPVFKWRSSYLHGDIDAELTLQSGKE